MGGWFRAADCCSGGELEFGQQTAILGGEVELGQQTAGHTQHNGFEEWGTDNIPRNGNSKITQKHRDRELMAWKTEDCNSRGPGVTGLGHTR